MHDLGYIKEIKTDSVIFIVDAGEVEIEVDAITKDALEVIFRKDDEALIQMNAESGKMNSNSCKTLYEWKYNYIVNSWEFLFVFQKKWIIVSYDLETFQIYVRQDEVYMIDGLDLGAVLNYISPEEMLES